MWILTEGKKHLLTFIGIQTLQNVHNANIIPNSETGQVMHAFKAICVRAFLKKVISLNTFKRSYNAYINKPAGQSSSFIKSMHDLFEPLSIKGLNKLF